MDFVNERYYLLWNIEFLFYWYFYLYKVKKLCYLKIGEE